MKKNRACFSGSFDPFHKGHLYVLLKGLNDFKFIYILISINTNKHQSSFLKRKKQIQTVLNKYAITNVEIVQNMKLTVEKATELKCNYLIRGYRNKNDLIFENRMKAMNEFLNPKIKTILYKTNEECKNIRSSNSIKNS